MVAENSTREPHRLVVSSIGVAIPTDRNTYGYLSEHHSFGETEDQAGEYAEELAAEMLATTLDVDFDPDKSWDEKKEIYRISNKIVRTANVTQSADRRQARPLDHRHRRGDPDLRVSLLQLERRRGFLSRAFRLRPASGKYEEIEQHADCSEIPDWPGADVLLARPRRESRQGRGPRARSRARAERRLVCLPELFRAQYFCQREDAALFDLAEPIPGPDDGAAGGRGARGERAW